MVDYPTHMRSVHCALLLSFTSYCCFFPLRPMHLLLKPAVMKGYVSLMMLKRKKRTSGRRRRSTMQHKLNPEQGGASHFHTPSFMLPTDGRWSSFTPCFRFGVSQTSEGGSRGRIENGGQEQACELQTDEEEDTEQSTSDTGITEYSNSLHYN